MWLLHRTKHVSYHPSKEMIIINYRFVRWFDIFVRLCALCFVLYYVSLTIINIIQPTNTIKPGHIHGIPNTIQHFFVVLRSLCLSDTVTVCECYINSCTSIELAERIHISWKWIKPKPQQNAHSHTTVEETTKANSMNQTHPMIRWRRTENKSRK